MEKESRAWLDAGVRLDHHKVEEDKDAVTGWKQEVPKNKPFSPPIFEIDLDSFFQFFHPPPFLDQHSHHPHSIHSPSSNQKLSHRKSHSSQNQQLTQIPPKSLLIPNPKQPTGGKPQKGKEPPKIAKKNQGSREEDPEETNQKCQLDPVRLQKTDKENQEKDPRRTITIGSSKKQSKNHQHDNNQHSGNQHTSNQHTHNNSEQNQQKHHNKHRQHKSHLSDGLENRRELEKQKPGERRKNRVEDNDFVGNKQVEKHQENKDSSFEKMASQIKKRSFQKLLLSPLHKLQRKEVISQPNFLVLSTNSQTCFLNKFSSQTGNNPILPNDFKNCKTLPNLQKYPNQTFGKHYQSASNQFSPPLQASKSSKVAIIRPEWKIGLLSLMSQEEQQEQSGEEEGKSKELEEFSENFGVFVERKKRKERRVQRDKERIKNKKCSYESLIETKKSMESIHLEKGNEKQRGEEEKRRERGEEEKRRSGGEEEKKKMICSIERINHREQKESNPHDSKRRELFKISTRKNLRTQICSQLMFPTSSSPVKENTLHLLNNPSYRKNQFHQKSYHPHHRNPNQHREGKRNKDRGDNQNDFREDNQNNCRKDNQNKYRQDKDTKKHYKYLRQDKSDKQQKGLQKVELQFDDLQIFSRSISRKDYEKRYRLI